MVDTTVDPQVLVRGLQGAYDRLLEKRDTQNDEEMYIPVFEALNWVVAIEATQPNVPSLEHVFIGFRHVRNTVHHDWANAIYLGDGAAFPIVFPTPWHEWYWRKPDHLPPKRSASSVQNTAYAKHLADQPVRITIHQVLIGLSVRE